MQSIVFEFPFIVNTNDIYAGVHWGIRNKHKNKYREVLFKKIEIEKFPVDTHYHFMSNCRTMDSSNLTYAAKLIEDCLRTKKILPDDSQKYVRNFTTSFEKSDKNVCVILIQNHNPLDREMLDLILGR